MMKSLHSYEHRLVPSVVRHEVNTLLDGWLELLDAQVLDNAFGSKHTLGGEPLATRSHVALDICAHHLTSLTLLRPHQGQCEVSSSLGHGKRGRSCSCLGEHNFCATVLDTVGECFDLLL